MSRPFRLRAVERLRSARLEEAGRVLGLAQRTLTETLQAQEDLRRRLLHETDLPADPSEAESAAWHRVLVRERIDELGRLGDEQRGEVDVARIAWLAARADLRAVQALHERHRRALRAEQLRAEQRELDDLASRRSLDPFAPLPAGTDDQPPWDDTPSGGDAA